MTPIDFLAKWRQMVAHYEKMFKPLTDYMMDFQKAMLPLAKQLSQLFTQFQTNFITAISALEPPKTYNSQTTQLSEGIHKTALLYAPLIDTIDKTPLSFLKVRLESGLVAHEQGNYRLSIYEFFSTIDGMLTWFYCTKRNCRNFPDSNQKLKLFFSVYKFEKMVGKKTLEPKFKIFYQHRNEIMHGGQYAHFDKNISTIALLFLGMVYYSLTETK